MVDAKPLFFVQYMNQKALFGAFATKSYKRALASPDQFVRM